ncbi:MAG: hypothetical protein HDP34_01475 [Clostridia bacterium]|nr:hypothetical protein [Clostridia bacterium]
MRMRKRDVICYLMFSLFLIVFAVPIRYAHAETFEERIPTYGLYCEDSEIIKSGTVNFDLTDANLLSKGKGVKQSSYQVTVANREVEFAIPFVSSAMKLPSISVKVNGQEVAGSVWYGHSGYWQDYDFDIDKTYSPVLDESIIGTLYTFIPDSETVTVSLKLNEWKSYIYETTNHYSSSDTADGSHIWNLKEASPLHEYSFFIFGDSTECTFESSCGYRTETISCKDFVDNQYKKFEEYFDHNGGVPIELFYSVVNRVIQENTVISYNELFLRSIDTYRVNAYKFRVSLEADAVIKYELPIDVQRNYAFEPMIYGVEQYRVGEYPISYRIELNNDNPYIIESSVNTERGGTGYIAETTEDFSFVFSSSEKPQNINDENNKIETWRIVLFVLSGVFGCALIVSLTMLIYYSVKYKKAHKGNK